MMALSLTSLNLVFTIGDQVGESIVTHGKLKKNNLIANVIEVLKQVKILAPEKRIGAFPHQMS